MLLRSADQAFPGGYTGGSACLFSNSYKEMAQQVQGWKYGLSTSVLLR